MRKPIVPKSPSGYRKATKAELARMGATEKSERYVPKDAKRIGSNFKAWLSKRRYQQLQTGVTLERRAKEIRAGERVSKHVEHAERTRFKIHAYSRELLLLPARPSQQQLDEARRRAGLSEAQFARYRREGRVSASAWEKPKGSRVYVYRGPQSWRHAFINDRGVIQRASVSGENLVAMQDYRENVSLARRLNDNTPLDGWKKAWPEGVYDDSGERIYPSTDLKQINARIARMSPRERAQYESEVEYALEAVA